jgi:hypothetical protein
VVPLSSLGGGTTRSEKALPKRVPLDNVEHGSLRVDAQGLPELDNVNQTLVVPGEFEDVQREFPILLRRDRDGKFVAVALLGFEKGENLFLADGRWTTRYVPAAHRRGPFYLGVRETNAGSHELAVHIDLDDPRVGSAEGESIFRELGGNSRYLDRAIDALHVVHDGLASAPEMFGLLEELGLIQPIAIEAKLDDGRTYELPSMFTIAMDRLQALTGAEIERLHRSGLLAPTIFIRSSLPNLNRLIELKQRKLSDAFG